MLVAAVACAPSGPEDSASQPIKTPGSLVEETSASGPKLVLGDIEPNEPAYRIRQIKPLADYLSAELADLGYTGGYVRIARDLEEMISFLEAGEVDLYMDSVFPTLIASEESGGKLLAQRWGKGDPVYWSLFVGSNEQASKPNSVAELTGQVVVGKERHSTTGFLLPACEVQRRGIPVSVAATLDGEVPADEIGFYMSGDEETTLNLVFSQRVAAGVISNQDYDELPQELRESLHVIDRTGPMPRALVVASPLLKPDKLARIRKALLEVDPNSPALSASDWTWKFSSLTDAEDDQLGSLNDCLTLLRDMPS